MQDATSDGDVQRRSQWLHRVADAAPDAVFVVAADGRIVFANARAAVIFGRPVDDLVGSDIEGLVPDRTDPTTQLTARRADGTEFPVDVSLSPLPKVEGAGVICVVRDATDRVRAERALMRSETLLHEGQQRVAVAQARERIGMDLHDGVIQSLYSVGMQLAAAERVVEDPVYRAEFTKAIDAIDEVIGEIRSYIHGLQPGGDDGRALAPTLFGLAAEFEAATGVTVRIEVDDVAAERIEDWGEDCVQIVRELLSNVARHAEATSVRLSLVRAVGSAGDSGDPTGVVLTVADDGVGFDPHDPHTGLGAGNIRRRVQPSGGAVEIVSAPGAGTTVRVEFPQRS